MIDSTIITQGTDVVNPMVAHADLNIHNDPVIVRASIFHVTTFFYFFLPD